MRRLSVSNRGTSVLLILLFCLQLSVGQTKAPANASLELVIKDPSGALIHRAQVDYDEIQRPNQQRKQIKRARQSLTALRSDSIKHGLRHRDSSLAT